jgi:hypothetical protein
MSALGHKRTFCDAIAMSALPPKADKGGTSAVAIWRPFMGCIVCVPHLPFDGGAPQTVTPKQRFQRTAQRADRFDALLRLQANDEDWAGLAGAHGAGKTEPQ